MYADVIVDISSENLDKTYQYLIPEELEESAVVGSPVEIPFGKSDRKIRGYIVGISFEPKLEISRIKPVYRIPEGGLAIEEQLIVLAAWMKEMYGATMNEALRTVIPVKKKIREEVKRTVVSAVEIEHLRLAYETALQKNHVAKARLLSELIDQKSLKYELVTQKLNIAKSTLDRLVKAGLIRIETQRIYRGQQIAKKSTEEKKELNTDQKNAAGKILLDYQQKKLKTYLLYGVTGSGKTEVYLEVIEGVVANGQQVIVLIPEIALTYQTVKRFSERFGERVAILNSKMSQGERYDQSERAKRGEIDIMIGPRSALFTPFPKLGMIIIDEEHETSYKSEMPPKYHARETAIERARLAGASVILGSATPSLEAFFRAKQGEYELLSLPERANQARLPAIHVVDLREELKQKNRSMFSRTLRELMIDRLKKQQQIMLFLNRRGYSGFISCRSCGYVFKCPHCDISLTSHRNGTLVCHYCGYEEIMPPVCPACGSKYIAAFGTGTQKVEDMVRKEFPDSRILRMDADTTKNKESYEEILSAFANQEADILIGTQMIVKGHDFPKVTLVGILAADLSLNAGDYRAAERTYQLLSQAAGRAGRGSSPGEVVIQTYQPEHYSIETAAAGDYEGFFRQELAFRSLMNYPPAAHILALLVLSENETKLTAAASLLGAAANEWILQNPQAKSTELIGPAAAALSKANDIYRHVLYFKQKDYAILVGLKNFLEAYLLYSKQFSGCSVQFDFDPLHGY